MSFWDECRIADARIRRERANYRGPDDSQLEVIFEASSVDATAWIIKHHPERLADWMARHLPRLEEVARERMNKSMEASE
jgi:hypothetical protein